MTRATTWLTALAVAVGLGGASPARAADPAGALSTLGGNDATTLATSLRGLILQILPSPLFKDEKHWGLQEEVVRGVKWKGKLRLKPQLQKSLKNHGQWWKVEVTADNPRDTLLLDVRDVARPARDTMHFTTYIAFDTRIVYDRQHWRSGVRTYAGSVRARARVRLTMRCEATTRVEGKDQLFPDVIFRLRVLQANLQYDNLKVEHLPGFGGEAAEILGAAFHACMRQWRPSLERSLLARANEAIVKAGDTKEIRLGLSGLLGK